MIIALKKRKENIAEYLLYMWQVEDLIRAARFDAETINREIVARYDQPADVKKAIASWYAGLCTQMHSEGIEEKGHLKAHLDLMAQLSKLHRDLLRRPDEQVYIAAYYKTLPLIVQLRAKSAGSNDDEIATCFTALYGYLNLRMQGREISQPTVDAMKQISLFLACLAEKFKAWETENLKA
ncbi:MAG: DUF4924 family protein [Tannerella sp.]|jgi:hypothetical protein|nr:DUF4924 family protein [Tannerella sp.]